MSAWRIAVLLPHLGVYGGVRRFLELGNAWQARGHTVALLLAERASAREPWLPFTGRVGVLGDLAGGAWDIVMSPDPGLLLEARAPGALRAYYAVLEGAPGERRAAASADVVLANSRSMRRYLSRRGIDAADAAGGVDPVRFRPADPDPRADRDGAPVRALVYGRLSRRRKGSWAAVRAVELASRRTGVPVTLTLFDAPPAGAPAPELPRPLAIPHRWVLHPTQEALRGLYRDADLFVAAERRAGWCNTAAEAMASGAAVVCTRSGTEDFAADEVTALVRRWPWSWVLADAAAALLRDPGRRRSLAARGRERILEFSWERTADRIERALGARLGARPVSGATVDEAAVAR